MAKKQSNLRKTVEKPRSIQDCNFRSAGRLSNENARALTAIHEAFAHSLGDALDAYLGTKLKVKLQRLDQIPIKEHIANISSLNYIVPCSIGAMPGTVAVECDIDVIFPIIELLLGGTGGSPNDARGLSEIEEEVLGDVISLIARLAEAAWRLPETSMVAGRSINPTLLDQYFSPNERVTLIEFEIEIAGSAGSFQFVIPASFTNVLLNKLKIGQPRAEVGLRPTGALIRERILDCDVVVTAGLPSLKVAVYDLISLQPGCVLKLRAPIRSPGMLSIGELEIFEAVPVRNRTQKAAQLGCRAQRISQGGE